MFPFAGLVDLKMWYVFSVQRAKIVIKSPVFICIYELSISNKYVGMLHVCMYITHVMWWLQ